jgi:hypothetical protein
MYCTVLPLRHVKNSISLMLARVPVMTSHRELANPCTLLWWCGHERASFSFFVSLNP